MDFSQNFMVFATVNVALIANFSPLRTPPICPAAAEVAGAKAAKAGHLAGHASISCHAIYYQSSLALKQSFLIPFNFIFFTAIRLEIPNWRVARPPPVFKRLKHDHQTWH